MRRIKAAVAALVATASMALVVTPAQAGTTNYNTRTQLLAMTPNSGMSEASVTTVKWLPAGNYTWSQYNDFSAWGGGASRTIYLAAGWYDWDDYLVPENGDYIEQSYLTLRGAGLGSANQYSYLYMGRFGGYTNGTWGSTLTAS